MNDLPLVVVAVMLIALLFSAVHGSLHIQQDDLRGRDKCVLTDTCRPSSP